MVFFSSVEPLEEHETDQSEPSEEQPNRSFQVRYVFKIYKKSFNGFISKSDGLNPVSPQNNFINRWESFNPHQHG